MQHKVSFCVQKCCISPLREIKNVQYDMIPLYSDTVIQLKISNYELVIKSLCALWGKRYPPLHPSGGGECNTDTLKNEKRYKPIN